MGEPPLWSPDTPGQSKHEVYRFLWLRSFHPHVAIRAEKDSDGARIVLIVPQGGGYGIGGSWSKKSRNVADHDSAELVQKIDWDPSGCFRAVEASVDSMVPSGSSRRPAQPLSCGCQMERWGDQRHLQLVAEALRGRPRSDVLTSSRRDGAMNQPRGCNKPIVRD